MIRLFGNPGRVAQAMVDALENGEIRTPGAWSDWIRHYERLPCSLQSWTMQRVREIAGDETCNYLLSQMGLADARVAA